jgi:thiamine pyrophosphokinase
MEVVFLSRALIFANGEFDHPDMIRRMLQTGDVIIAADGGARHAAEVDLIPDVVIGDLDSLTEDEILGFSGSKTQIIRYSPVKDETDLELALRYAQDAGYSPILIIGAYGGRLDQTLGNIALLSEPGTLELDVRLDDGLTEAFFVHEQATIRGDCGDLVSLLPWGSSAEGVSTTNLVYPLDNEIMYSHRTRGISNEMSANIASVSLKKGLLLCIHVRKDV